MTEEEQELQRQAKRRKPYGFIEFSETMKAKLNKIALMYFEGNYRFKPSYTSMINFAFKNPTEQRIKRYLKSKVFQDKYSQFD